MTKKEKEAILKIAFFALSELKRLSEPQQYQARQAHRDTLAAFKFYGFIDDFNIDKGVLIGNTWSKNK